MAQAKMDFVINTKVDKTAFVELKREIQALQGLTEKDLINFWFSKQFPRSKENNLPRSKVVQLLLKQL